MALDSSASTVADLGIPQGALDDAASLVKSAGRLTAGTIVSIFIPGGFFFVLGFSILRVVQARSLCRAYPRIDEALREWRGVPKDELRRRADADSRIKTLLQFRSARIAFWVTLALPFLYFGFIAAMVAYAVTMKKPVGEP